MHAKRLFIHLGVLAGAIALAPIAHAADWPQFGFDAAHSGNNTAETVLSPTNVTQLVSLFPGGAALAAKVDSVARTSAWITATGAHK